MNRPPDVRQHFEEYAEQEWDRFENRLTGRIEYAVHRNFLMKHVRLGDSVLDLGCGPGRYAIDMMQAGANVTLGDVSAVQLDIARQKIAEAVLDATAALELDIRDLSRFDEGEFDLVVCIGGALSYVHEDYATALREMARVVKPGGRLVVASMSLYGLLPVFAAGDKAGQLRTFDQHIDRRKLLDNPGYLITEPDSPVIYMPLFLCTNRYLRDFVESLGFRVVGSAAANPLTTDGQKLERISADPEAEATLIDLEVSLSERPELADSGEWVIVAAEKLGA